MAQLRYECSHCTKLSCNHAAATQHNRDAHGGQANILPERSKAQMRVNDFEQRAEIARLTSEVTQLRADLANAGAVMVEACARKADEHYAAGDMGNPGHHIRALSTLSPIAAAAGMVADAIDADMRTFNQCLDEEPATEDMKVGHFFAQVMRRYARALAEQEKADG